MDDQEILSLRSRLHEVSNQLHVATVRVEVTSTKLDSAIAHLERFSTQLAGIEIAVRDLQQAKANLDGRLFVMGAFISAITAFLMWVLLRMFPKF